MGIAVEVPGLNTILPEFEEGRVLVVESGADPAKSFFVRHLALSAHRGGRPVTFVTTRDRDELEAQLARESGAAPWTESEMRLLEHLGPTEIAAAGPERGLLAVDSFSFLNLDAAGPEVARLLRELRAIGRHRRTTVVLATDRGMADARSEAIVAHLADGVLQFHSREGPEGLVRFLRVPKWTDGRVVDRNIHYEFDGTRLAVDLRSRVL